MMTEKPDNFSSDRDKNQLHQRRSTLTSAATSAETLAQLSRALLTANTLEGVLHASLEVILPTDVDGVILLLASGPPEDKYLEITAAWGRDGQPTFPVGTRFSAHDYLFQPLLTTGQSVVINDLATDERVSEYLRFALLQAEIGSVVALPLGSEQDYFGAILIDRTGAKPFSPENIHTYEIVAALATGTVEKLRLIRQTKQALAETSALYEISCRLSESQSVNDILQTVLDSELFGAAGGTIALLETSGQELVFWAAAGAGAEEILGIRMPISEGVVGWVVRENEPALVPDAYADERFYRQMDEDIEFCTQSILCVPLRIEGQVIGAIELVDVRPRALSEEGLRLLGQVADQAALLLDHQKLLAETKRLAQNLSLLLEVSRDLTSTLDREQALKLITARATDLVEGDGCHVFLLQTTSQGEEILVPVATSSSDYVEQILETILKVGEGITGHVVQSGVGEIVNRVDLDPRGFTVPGTSREPENLISVPLISKGQVIGAMTVSRLGEEGFAESDLQVISALAGHAATVLENTRLFQEVQQRGEELTALNAVVSTASQSLSLEEILDATLEGITQVMPGSAGLICLNDPATNELQLAAHCHMPKSLVQRLRKRGMGGTLCEVTASEGQTYSVPDFTHDAPVDTTGLVKVGLRAYLGTPLIAHGQVLGTLSVFSAEPNTFTPADAALLTAIGQQVGIAVRNARLYEQTEHALGESQALYETSQAIAATLELEDVLQITIKRMAEYVGADQCRVVLFDASLGYGRVRAEYHPTPGVEDVRIPMEGNPSYEVLRDTGRAIAIEDVHTHPVTAKISEMLTQYGIKSMLLVPLIVQGRLIGSIGLDAIHAHRTFNESEINFCRTLADRAALTIENRRLFAQTQEALQETTMLYRANRALTQAHNLPDVLHAILDNLPIKQIDQCWIALVEPDSDPDNRSVEISAMWDHEGDNGLIGTHFTPHELPIITQADTIETWVVDDLENEARFDTQSIATLQALGVKSALIVPLMTGGTLLGWLLLITHHQTHAFDPDQIRPYQILADQAAVVIKNQQLLQQVRTSLEEVEKVHRQYLRDEWGTFLRSKEKQSTAVAYDQGTLIPDQELWHPLIGEAVNQGAIVTSPSSGKTHHDDDSTLRQRPELLEGELAKASSTDDGNGADQAGASLVMPLQVRGQVIGTLGLEDPEQAREWTMDELGMVQEIAAQVALAIENARLIDTTQASLAETARLAARLDAAAKVGRAATSILERDKLLSSVVELIRDHFNYYHAQIFLLDPTGRWAVLQASTGEIGQKLLQRGHALEVGGSTAIGYVTDSGELKLVSGVEEDTVHFKNDLLPDTRSEIALPLKIGKRVIGALDVQSTEPDAFGPDDVSVLSTLADQLAIALENARLYQEQLRTAEKLREIDQVKSQFMASMSHELRTPLNSIIGFSRVILKGIDGPLTELQEQDLTAIYNSGTHLLGLINDILDLSKIEAGKMELGFEETDLNPIIKGIVSTSVALLKDKPEVEVTHYVAPDLPLIIIDATRVRQVLLNLMGNAAKFTSKGHVHLEATYDARYVTIKVSDTGIGIPSDKFDVIFKEFEQADSSTTRAYGGTGLGLPISKHFIELHGGRIWVESEVGVGSTFTVQLPIKGPQAAEEEEEELIIDPHRHLILAIDDDDDAIKLYKRHLEQQTYQIIGLTESGQAVQKVRELRPYAILLDLLMPGKDGWSILRELKADPETQDIPVIICSIVSAAGQGFSLGAADYIVKPITANRLLAALTRLSDDAKRAPDEAQRVLIIDDTPEDRQLLRRTLESASEAYQVIEASGGLEGIEIIQEQRPDLVILDLMMPEMDGFAVLEMLKSDRDMRRIPIIIVTAKELTAQERTQLDGQVAALFQKGLFHEKELLQDVDHVLRWMQKRQQAEEKAKGNRSGGVPRRIPTDN